MKAGKDGSKAESVGSVHTGKQFLGVTSQWSMPLHIASVQFSHSVVSDSLWPHESQHARPPCPSPTPGVYSNSCPLNWWCYPTISSSVVPFSSRLQSFPASGSFQMSQFFASGGQSIGVSASASVFPMNIQDWHLLGWTGWNLLAIQGTLKILLQHHNSKASIPWCSAFFIVQLSHGSEGKASPYNEGDPGLIPG